MTARLSPLYLSDSTTWRTCAPTGTSADVGLPSYASSETRSCCQKQARAYDDAGDVNFHGLTPLVKRLGDLTTLGAFGCTQMSPFFLDLLADHICLGAGAPSHSTSILSSFRENLTPALPAWLENPR